MSRPSAFRSPAPSPVTGRVPGRVPGLVIGLVLCLVLLAGCAKAPAPAPEPPRELRDLTHYPQTLSAYLKDGGTRPILTDAQTAAAFDKYRRTFFGPWLMRNPSISRKEVSRMLNAKARGWKDGENRWAQAEWATMRDNADMGTYPNVNRPGITLKATNLRELPTHEGRYTKPTPDPAENPFDYFQYSRLPVGLPVLLCQMTRDGRWYYVETSIACGWVDANDLAEVDEPFQALWRSASLMAVTQEHTALGETGQFADLGTILPSAGANQVYLPVRQKDGKAGMQKVALVEGAVELMPVRLTQANVARLANQMMGQKYGWGGMLGLRDCSAMTRDLMAPFGIWLPRNSQAQARTGERISLRDMTADEREGLILREGVPFASLITMKGHVMFYLGEYDGRAAILHDIWGIRVDEPEGEDQRLIIGKVVVTGLTPGRELPNLTENKTLVDSFHTLTLLGGAKKQ